MHNSTFISRDNCALIFYFTTCHSCLLQPVRSFSLRKCHLFAWVTNCQLGVRKGHNNRKSASSDGGILTIFHNVCANLLSVGKSLTIVYLFVCTGVCFFLKCEPTNNKRATMRKKIIIMAQVRKIAVRRRPCSASILAYEKPK